LFQVRTRRRVFLLVLDGTAAGEVAVDRTTIPVADGSEAARLRRVEVEVPESAVPTIAPFVESLRTACGLQPAGLSKFEAGLLARGLKPATAPDLGSIHTDASRTVGEVAFGVLRRNFGALLANEPGARIGDDPEDLHDMRVATRRLRAALSLFVEALPVRVARFRPELGWVADALGAVRDLDVQRAQLQGWTAVTGEEEAAALEPLVQILEEQWSEARGRMLAVLDSMRYQRLIEGLSAALRRGPLRTSPASRQPVLAAAPDLILQRYRTVLRRGRHVTAGSGPTPYHRLRIAGKRLRYALEFLSEVYPNDIPSLVKGLVRLQDLLGLHQDADVAVRRLRSTVAERGDALSPATAFAMGMVARRYLEQQEDLRKRFPKEYAGLSGKPWNALEREMKRRRPRPAHSPVLRPVKPLAGVPATAGVRRLTEPRGAG
jgi:CHAD domain-containing protein